MICTIAHEFKNNLVLLQGFTWNFWWMAHQNFQGPLISRGPGGHRSPVGSSFKAPVGGPGGQSPPAEIDFKHFSCAQTASPGVIFRNNELVFAPLETKKKKRKLLRIYQMVT